MATPTQRARAEILQLAAAAADTLARDRASKIPPSRRPAVDIRADVWAAEIDALTFGLAAPALKAVDAIELRTENLFALVTAIVSGGSGD